MTFRIIKPNECFEMIEKLAIKIKDNDCFSNIKGIMGIPRGGLPIAVYLSHLLKKPLLEKQEIFSKIAASRKDKCHEYIIVDDIADSGKTLTKNFYNFPTATLFIKPNSIHVPTFYIENTIDWIVFPWEDKNDIENDARSYEKKW